MITVQESKKRYSRNDIVSALEGFILENNIRGGSRLPGAAQLAAQFNVSDKTIHRAMDKLVEKRILYRVRGHGTFVCDHIRPKFVKSVGLLQLNHGMTVLPGLDRLAFDNFHEELEKRLREEDNCKISTVRINTSGDEPLQTVPLELFDCIIAEAGWLASMPKLFDSSHKVILIRDSRYHRGGFNQVLVDYVPGFRKALRRFRERHIRQFFIAGVTSETSLRRYEAVMLAASLEGFQPEQFRFYQSTRPYYAGIVAAGIDCAQQYLANNDRSAAIISLSDYISLGISDELERAGLVAGVDVPMVSYDHLLWQLPEFAGKFHFDSISHPVSAMIEAVIQVYREIIRDGEDGFSRALIVPAREFLPAEP